MSAAPFPSKRAPAVRHTEGSPVSTATYLPDGLAPPDLEGDPLYRPYWQGLMAGRLLIQQCPACATYQFGPECLCHACHAFDPAWVEVRPVGRLYSWSRYWHPVHPSLIGRGPYLVVLVELEDAPGVRLLGNLLGDAMLEPTIGARLAGRFEPHAHERGGYSLLQWASEPAHHSKDAR